MTGTSAVAGLLAGAAVVVVGTGAVARRLPREAADGDHQRRWPVVPRTRIVRLGPVAWVVAVALILVGPAEAAVAALGLGALLAAGRWRAARAREHRTEAVASAVADLADALAADLTAGHPPLAALAAVAGDLERYPGRSALAELSHAVRQVAASGGLGGDVPAGLRKVGELPGARSLHEVAAGWQVADETGAALAKVLDEVASGIRRRQAAGRRLAVSMGGARASARLLVTLPAFGLLIGAGLGVSPLAFLLGPWPGRLCLVTGLGLSAAGLAWTDRIAVEAGRALLP